jgi:hypothetical protein
MGHAVGLVLRQAIVLVRKAFVLEIPLQANWQHILLAEQLK